MAARAREWAARTFREDTFYRSLHNVLAGTLPGPARTGAEAPTKIGNNSAP